MSKISALLAQAAVIRDATAEKENTALRVGSMFVSFVQAVLDTMPPEVIDATGISLASAADKITVTLKTLDEDGAAGTRSIVIPTATADKAGLLSPATLKAMSKAVADVATAVQAATDAVNTAETALTTAGEAKTAADAAVNTAATAKTTADKASTTASHTAVLLAGLHILPVDGIGITGDDIFPSAATGIYWDTEDREFIGQPNVNGYEQEDYFAQDADGDWLPRTDRIYSCGGALYHIVAGQMVPLHQAGLDTLSARVTTAEKRLAGTAILPIDATFNLGTVVGAQQEGVRFDTRAGAFVGDFAAAGYAETDYNEKYSESELVLPTWRGRRDRIYRCGTELYNINEAGALVKLHSAAIEDAKTALLKKRWTTACTYNRYPGTQVGGWDAERGYWLGSTTNLSETDVLRILAVYRPGGTDFTSMYDAGKIGILPALIPPMQGGSGAACDYMYQGQSTVTEIRQFQNNGVSFCVTSAEQMFYGCAALASIPDPLEIKAGAEKWGIMFYNCAALAEVRLILTSGAISLRWSPLLSRASVEYLATKKKGTDTLTVTVHADVYAKLTGDTTNAAAAALTPEELAAWQQIVTDAAEKNISFATA